MNICKFLISYKEFPVEINIYHYTSLSQHSDKYTPMSNLAPVDMDVGKKPVTSSHVNQSQILAEQCHKLVLCKFTELTGFSSQQAQRNGLAGVVMTTGESEEDPRVICVTTGNSCITGEYMSNQV